MILVTPCALCSSSSTRSRNGRVPDFELLRRPTTRPSSVGTRLASGTAFPALTAAGTSNSMVAMPAAPSLSTNLVLVDDLPKKGPCQVARPHCGSASQPDGAELETCGYGIPLSTGGSLGVTHLHPGRGRSRALLQHASGGLAPPLAEGCHLGIG